MKIAVPACLMLTACAVVNPKEPVHSAIAPTMKAQVDAAAVALDRLLARTDSPTMTDPDLIALIAPADDAPTVTQSSRADWVPFVAISKKWSLLITSLQHRPRNDASAELVATLDEVAWSRAFVIAGRRINAVEHGNADENAHHEHGLLTVEHGVASTLVDVMLVECTGNPGAAKASTWAYLSAPTTYAPLRASVLALYEQWIEQLLADPKGATCGDELRVVASVVAQARAHAIAP